MDGSAFDQLSRLLALAGSRRGLIVLLSGVSAGVLTDSVNAVAEQRAKQRRLRSSKRQRRRAGDQDDLRTEACIPSGRTCPRKARRGKRRKLSCNRCCQGSFIVGANRKKVCACQPDGGTCSQDRPSSCCSGVCDQASSTCCVPEEPALTCTGHCGEVENNCGQVVSCKPCECDPVCGPCNVCSVGECVPCPGCCDGSETCQGGNSDKACGVDNAMCEDCTANGQVCGGDGVCCYATVQEFAALLADPTGPATIHLCAGSFEGEAIWSIERPVTIIGAGDGNGGTVLSQVYVVAGTEASPVHLTNLAITGGSRGITADGDFHWAMTDCTVRDNTRSAVGHGLFNRGTMTLTRCKILNNGARLGAEDDGGGGLANTGSAILADCCFTGNLQLYGGGIDNGGSLTMIDTRVFGNIGTNSSGGLRNFGNITVSGATVICNNTSTNCQGYENPDVCGASPCPSSCST